MNRRVYLVYQAIYVLNFLIVVFFSVTIAMTIYRICDEDQARAFLEHARYLPHVPWKVPTYTISLFILLGISNYVKMHILKERHLFKLLLFLLDLVICGLISYYLNFSYKGFFLLLIAGLFIHTPIFSLRVITLGTALLFFILFDYDLLTVRLNMVSFQDFLYYYEPSVQISIYSARSTLNSANLILIILFFYTLIQSKISENKEFIELNRRLSSNLRKLEIANIKLEEVARMRERNRLAREIHDILGHSLTCISTGLEACLEYSRDNMTGLRNQLVKIKEIANNGLLDIRRSVRELKMDAVEDRSLLIAVRKLVSDVNSVGKHKVELEILGEPEPLQPEEKTTVYRIIQESLTNSVRHGRASYIVIEIHYTGECLDLMVRDNGLGTESLQPGFGLQHMEERISLLGGEIRFSTVPGEGFLTEVRLPLKRIRSID